MTILIITALFLLASSYRSVVFSGRRLDVEAFITALLARKTEFIVKKLQERLEVAERAEVVKYLLALHDGGVLDQEQYNEIRRKAGLEDESKPKVGFA